MTEVETAVNTEAPTDQRLAEILEKVNESEISSTRRVISEIIRVINDSGSTAKDLKEIIEIDPPLTAKVLKRANSAYYARPNRISEIQQAIIWIGFDALKELALNQKVWELFEEHRETRRYSRLALWKHSVAAALLAKHIYRREYGRRGENAYAAGLLHNIGIIIEDQFLSEEFATVLDRMEDTDKELPTIEREVFGFDHADIGRIMAEEWSFPAELPDAIGYHHNPDAAGTEYQRITKTLYIADVVCHEMNITYLDGEVHNGRFYRRYMQELDISKKALRYIANEVEEIIEEMDGQGWFRDGA